MLLILMTWMRKPMVVDQIIKWIGTSFFLTAGTLASLNIPETKWAFVLFLSGHVVLGVYFAWKRDTPMLVQNLFFIPIDILGIVRWF